MSDLDLIAKAEALSRKRAVELRTAGQYQLNDRPLMLAMFAWPGEDATIAAVVIGRFGEPKPRLERAITNARNRDDQYEFFLEIGDVLTKYFDECDASNEFPQVVISGMSTVSHIHAVAHRVLGLQTRQRQAGTPIADSTLLRNREVRWRLGQRIGYWAERTQSAGQQIVVPATRMLTSIWVTGQSELEDQHIHSVRTWIEADSADALLEGLAQAEEHSGGARSMPEFDNAVLEPALSKWQSARGRLRNSDRNAASRASGEVEVELTARASEVSRLFLEHLRPQYDAIRWAIGKVKSRKTIVSRALRELAEHEKKEYAFFRAGEQKGIPLYFRNAVAVRTQRFLEREALVNITESLYVLHDPVQAARAELSGKLFRCQVSANRAGVLVAKGQFRIAGPRKGDRLISLGGDAYTVASVSERLGETTLELRDGPSRKPATELLLIEDNGLGLGFLYTLKRNAGLRTRAQAWIYGGAPPSKRRSQPKTDLLDRVLKERKGL